MSSSLILIVLRQALLSISLTAARIWRLAALIEALIVQPAAFLWPPPPNFAARTVASQSPRVLIDQRVSFVRSGIW